MANESRAAWRSVKIPEALSFNILSEVHIVVADLRLTSARQAERARIRTRNQTIAPKGSVMSRTVPTSVPAIKMGQRTNIYFQTERMSVDLDRIDKRLT